MLVMELRAGGLDVQEEFLGMLGTAVEMVSTSVC